MFYPVLDKANVIQMPRSSRCVYNTLKLWMQHVLVVQATDTCCKYNFTIPSFRTILPPCQIDKGKQMKDLKISRALRELDRADYYDINIPELQCSLKHWLECMGKRKYRQKPRINQANPEFSLIPLSFSRGIFYKKSWNLTCQRQGIGQYNHC